MNNSARTSSSNALFSLNYFCVLLLSIAFLTTPFKLQSEGTPQLSPTATDLAILDIRASSGGFATFGSAGTVMGLCFEIKDPAETVYIGLSQSANQLAEISLFGSYDWQIVGPAGGVVHGPFNVGLANQNGNDYNRIVAGPDALVGAAGYSTTGGYTFSPGAAGVYCIEFDNTNTDYIRNLDITVADAAGNVIPGRLFSQNWALRTPCSDETACSSADPFAKPFEAEIYILTNDNFVHQIDYSGSGFRGLSFVLAFNDSGPGTSGNVIIDRRSINGLNSTNPDFKVFVNPPDPTCYEPPILGGIVTDPLIQNCTPGSVCIEFTVNQPGIIELLLDFNGADGLYTPNTTDVLVALRIDEGDPLTQCIPWDGNDGLGNAIDLTSGAPVPTWITYFQGEIHFMQFDVEWNNPGWVSNVVDPPAASFSGVHFWDDSAIDLSDNDANIDLDDDPSTGTNPPIIELNGMPQPAHFWNRYVLDPTFGTGLGEGNTINTWTFGNEVQAGPFEVNNCFVNVAPAISVAKGALSVTPAASGIAGNFDITYQYNMLNTGTEQLCMLSLEDDLVGQFGGAFIDVVTGPAITGGTAADPGMANTNFDGSGDAELLAGDGCLEVGETLVIELTVEIDPDAPGAIYGPDGSMENQATASGTDPDGTVVDDDSDSGFDPTGDTDEPTTTSIANLDVGKIAANVVDAASGTSGNFDVTYQFQLLNTGTDTLCMLSLVDDFMIEMGSAFIGLISGPTITGGTAHMPGTVNGSFDGMGNDEMLAGDACIATGENLFVEVTVEIDPDAAGAVTNTDGEIENQATGAGTDPDGNVIMDDSDNGVDPTNDTDEPTVLGAPAISVSKGLLSIVEAASSTAGNFDVTYQLQILNTGTETLCQISLEDDLVGSFGGAFIDLIDGPTITGGTASIIGTANGNYDGDAVIEMLGMDACIDAGQTIIVEITVEIDPDAPGTIYNTDGQLENQANASGTDATGNEVTDDSDDGFDPTSDTDEPTITSISNLDVGKVAGDAINASSGIQGNIDITYTFQLLNTGTDTLCMLSMVDDFMAEVGGAFVGIVSGPTISGGSAHLPGTANGGYDGVNDTEMLAGDGCIATGENLFIDLTVEMDPGDPGAIFNANGQIENQATGSGTDPDGNVITDDSDDGADPTNDTDEPTTVDPPCEIVCPADVTIELEAGECVVTDVDIMATLEGACNSPITYSPSLAGPFEVGTTTITASSIDLLGNVISCTFDITIVEYSGPVVFSCANHSNFSLDENCEFVITPNLILTGNNYGCIDDYCIEIVDADGNIHPNLFDYTDVGIIFNVSIIDCINNGNSCWGSILIEDKLAPEFDCAGDITVACNADDSILPDPGLVDNCDPNPTLTILSDEIEELGCGGDFAAIRTITYVAVDASGNTSAECVQTVYYENTDLADVEGPENVEDLDCSGSGWDANGSGYPEPNETGYPTIDGIPLDGPIGGFCSINLVYEDQILPLCGSGYKVLRTWTVFDWCISVTPGSNPVEFVQVIKIEDNQAPSISCPSTYEANALDNSCASAILLPAPSYSDNCASATSYAVEVPEGSVSFDAGSGLFLWDGPGPGSYEVIYTAVDDCDNESSCTMIVNITDNQPPIVVCDENTVVALSNTGNADAYAADFDDGSYDNCGDVYFKAMKESGANCGGSGFSTFDDVVTFCCDDIGNNVEVTIRVFDVDPGPGFVFNSRMQPGGDLFGHYNDCTVMVEVQDKIAPVIVAPDDITVSCTQDIDMADLQNPNSTIFGSPTVTDNCDFEVTVSVTGSTDCGSGLFVRTFTASDPNGSSTVSQNIVITDFNPFDGSNITWPSNIDVGCMAGTDPEDLPSNAAYPTYAQGACSLIGVTYTDEVFQYVDGVCAKILRTWSVIDWCQFDQANPGNSGIWEYVQIIKVDNNTAPSITSGCDNVQVCSYDDDCGNAEVEGLTITATDDCDGDNISYSYQIDAFSDGSIDINGTGNVADGMYPYGTHTITWTVADQCGNESTCSSTFSISDCKKPTPICINGLSTVIMPATGEVAIWASDFDSGSSFDNCTASENLLFSFSEDVNNTSIVFDCGNIGTNVVNIWVTDEAGNQDYCETLIVVTDNEGVCGVPSVALIAGNVIRSNSSDPIEEVAVYLNTNDPAMSNGDMFMTGANGAFAFANLGMYFDYDVKPVKNDDHLKGVTTLDIVKMQKHLLGIEQMTNPFEMIAADANNSQSVTGIDIIQVRQLILGIIDEFPSNDSWRFVSADYIFASPLNPWPFSETHSYVELEQSFADDSFIGVKVGDVNHSAVMIAGELEDRNGFESVNFTTKDRTVKAGESFEVEIAVPALIGFQFSLQLDGLEYEGMQDKTLGFGNEHIANPVENVLTLSYNQTERSNAGQSFVIQMRATKDGLLSEMLEMNSIITQAEAYGSNDVIFNTALVFENSTIEKTDENFILYQNEPNPFKESTAINFFIPDAQDVTISIYDTNGKLIYQHTASYDGGANQHIVRGSNLESASGVLFYKLASKDFMASKSMILIR